MDVTYLLPSLEALDAQGGELLAFGVFAGELPPPGVAGLVDFRLATRISKAILAFERIGSPSSALLTPGMTKLAFTHVLVLLGGARATFDRARALRLYNHLCSAAEGLGLSSVTLEPLTGEDLDADALAEAFERQRSLTQLCLLGEREPLKGIAARILRRRPETKIDLRLRT
jgi:hypothetical protein